MNRKKSDAPAIAVVAVAVVTCCAFRTVQRSVGPSQKYNIDDDDDEIITESRTIDDPHTYSHSTLYSYRDYCPE
jgi:hypothetical protein